MEVNFTNVDLTNPDGSVAKVDLMQVSGITTGPNGIQYFGHMVTADGSKLLVRPADKTAKTDGATVDAGPSSLLKTTAEASAQTSLKGEDVMALSGKIGFWGSQLIYRTLGSKITISDAYDTFQKGVAGLRPENGDLRIYRTALSIRTVAP